MAITAAAGKQLAQDGVAEAVAKKRQPRAPLPRLGVRARQIALITLLVALVVIITTVINIAHLTGVIINRTEKEASQVHEQIKYAALQQLGYETTDDYSDPYQLLASE